MPEFRTTSEFVSDVRQQSDALLMTITGEIDLHTTPDLRTDLLALLAKVNPKRLILNLSAVSYMDSSAIAVLVEALQKVRKTGGKVCLTNLQPRVKGIIEIARLNSLFAICADEAEALTK